VLNSRKDSSSILQTLNAAFDARAGLIEPTHESAFRLFSGFYEGYPDLVIDIYARTVIIFNYAENPAALQSLIQEIIKLLQQKYPWLSAGVEKPRRAASAQARRGHVIFGDSLDNCLREHGVLYAIDLLLDQEASFFLDTRKLRLWAQESLSGKIVLNAFAYTGSLGVAARSGGARQVLQLDLSRKSLQLAKKSYQLNHFKYSDEDFQVGDFWTLANRLRHRGALFDCVLLDAPLFASTKRGTVNLVTGIDRLINKVRPLVSHNGMLVVVNNALYVSGDQFMATLEQLCTSGYLVVEKLIPIPEDITGYRDTRVRMPPSDPAPFNHPTKIAILRAFRKDRRTA
jgi:23S rRNA (cytosine1962-C5)-methyltransferase